MNRGSLTGSDCKLLKICAVFCSSDVAAKEMETDVARRAEARSRERTNILEHHPIKIWFIIIA